jgi:hypothetical protein
VPDLHPRIATADLFPGLLQRRSSPVPKVAGWYGLNDRCSGPASTEPPQKRPEPTSTSTSHWLCAGLGQAEDVRCRASSAPARRGNLIDQRISSLIQPLVTLFSPLMIQFAPGYAWPTTTSSTALPIKSSWVVMNE